MALVCGGPSTSDPPNEIPGSTPLFLEHKLLENTDEPRTNEDMIGFNFALAWNGCIERAHTIGHGWNDTTEIQ